MQTHKLFCRSGPLGNFVVHEDILPDPGNPIRLDIFCRYNGCKRGGVFPAHVFLFDRSTDPSKKSRPIKHVYGQPGIPSEFLGDAKENE